MTGVSDPQTALERPYVLLSCCTSIDGCLDDMSPQRLLLSNDADFDRVDAARAESDAILVGAGTVRKDDPRLLVRSARRRQERVARGLHPSPIKVTVTNRGELDPSAQFFTAGTAGDGSDGSDGSDAERLVYCNTASHRPLRDRLAGLATVVDAGDPIDLGRLLTDLRERGVQRLMVEGGQTIHTQFLGAGLVDELHLVIAPFFVGEPGAPRLLGDGRFPAGPTQRATLTEVRQIGDVVLMRYAMSHRCPVD